MLLDRLHEIASHIDRLEKMVGGLFDGADDALTDRSTRKKVSGKLKSLDNALLMVRIRLRTHFNSLATIHTLPAEILTHIFTFVACRDEWMENLGITPYWGPSALGPAAKIVPLTEACRQWREILVRDSRFWAVVEDTMRTRPSSSGQQLAYPHYLHRNPNGPLFVKISTYPTEKTLNLLHKAGSRIRELFIHYDDSSTSRKLRSVISIPADALETCKISGIPGRNSTYTLFRGHTQHLRSLWLENLRWIPANTFPSLTHLLIEFITLRVRNLRFSFRELLILLEGSPHLQVIYFTELSHYSIINVPPMDTIVRKVTLARLRKLRISEYRPGKEANKLQLAVCNHIIRPSDCLIYISIHDSAHFDILASTLAISQPTRNMCIGFTESMSQSPPGRFHFQLFDSPPSPGIRVVLGLEVRLDVQKDDLTGNPKQLEPLGRAMSDSNGLFAHITTLHVHILVFRYLLSQDPSTLYTLTRLETLSVEITKPCDYHRQYSLGEGIHHSHDRPIAFPKLATLAVACGWSLRTQTCEFSVDVDNIRGIVASRKQGGYPLTRLVLVYWSPPEDLPMPEELHALVELRHDLESFDVFVRAYRGEDMSGKIHPVLAPESKECTYRGDVSRLWPAWR